MSSSESSEGEVDAFQSSPPTSPPEVSSPFRGPESSSNYDSDDSSDSTQSKSPPSSPVRGGQKRPAYGSYKNDPKGMVPRQTLASRAKRSKCESDPNDHLHEDCAATTSITSEPSSNLVLPFFQDEDHPGDLTGDEAAATADEGGSQGNGDHEDYASTSATSESDEDSASSGAASDSSAQESDSVNSAMTQDNLWSDAEVSDVDTREDDGRREPDLTDIASDVHDPFSDYFLFEGSEKTTDEAIYELINIALKNNWSQTSLRDTLRFHNSNLPPNHNMPRTHHLLLKRVRQFSVPLFEVRHSYCRPEMHSVESGVVQCECGSKDFGVFYELPLDKRIQYLFEHHNPADVIDSYSSKRIHQEDGNMHDIVHSSEYARVWGDNFSKYKITIILNTDGVSVHKSSKAKFWPLLFTIAEIDPKSRPFFTLVLGLFFDKKVKPYLNTYLKPFVKTLQKISQEGGVSWRHPRTLELHKSPVSCPLIIADAPARANCLNMLEHQAKYACLVCVQKTSKLPAPPTPEGQRRKRRLRRFVFQEHPSSMRTHQGMIAHADVAEARGESKKGHKGPTVLKDIPSLDLSTCVVSEYMHSVLIGVVKQIMTLWFFEQGEWYIGYDLPAMNTFLCDEVHPPNFMTRLPRSLEDFSYFKANEFRSFLLYFSLILVVPYLPDKFFQHWMLLVQGTFLLLSANISEEDFVSADVLIRLFVRDVGVLYGDKNYVYNVHQLLHLVLFVRRWGPLWATSAFNFENLNGVLARMLHGSKNEGEELLNQLFLAQGAQILRNKIVTDSIRRKHVTVLGKHLPYNLSDLESRAIDFLNAESLQFYGRILKGGEEFSSEAYDKQFKRRNSYIQFQAEAGHKNYGRIIVFCQSDEHVLCLVRDLKVVHTKFFFHRDTLTRIKHIIPVKESGEVLACEVQCIDNKLIQVGSYLCSSPNSVESNL